MAKYVVALVVSAVAGLAIVSCGSPTITCQTATCNSSTAMTYQACSHIDGTVEYRYGGMSCSCAPGNTSQCQTCANMVAAYCGAGGSGGGGGGGTGGSGGGGGSGSNCSIVGNFSNVTSSGAQVQMAVTGTSASGSFTLMITPPGGATTTITGNFTVAGTQISMTNTSAAPAGVNGCIGQTAVYNLTWDATCAHVTFTKISDQCQQRIGDANGATLTRQ